MDDTDSAVAHAIDRTLTDLIPDKHLYEPDLQLYLDYSLPPHPELTLLEGSEDDNADDSASEDATLPEDLISRIGPSWEEALQQTIPEQPSALTEGLDESIQETVDTRPSSAQKIAEVLREVGAHEDSGVAADQAHKSSDGGEGGDDSHTFLWPTLAPPLSIASRDMLPPTVQPDSKAGQDSSAAILICSGCEETLQHATEPDIDEQHELSREPGYDAGHLMPLRTLQAGGQDKNAETERRMLMQAVSSLKMENACLVDALGTHMSEVEGLRSALSDARGRAQAGSHEVSSGAQQADGPTHHNNHASGAHSQAFVMNERAEQRFRQLEIKVGQLRTERAQYERALRREVGEDVPLQKVLDEASDWRGRAQHITLLQERLLSLQESQGEAGKAQRSKHDQQHRDNLVRLRGEKQREVDRLRIGLEDCQTCLAVSQAKEQALNSRKRMLEKQVKGLRQKIGLLLDKSATDDKLISALRVPMAQYAPAAAGMPGSPDGVDRGNDHPDISVEEGRGAAAPEHQTGLRPTGHLHSSSVTPVVVPRLHLQPSTASQDGEWTHAADDPGGNLSESILPVHRVSFAISMDISALSGTSSHVEIMPVTENIVLPAHAQLCRSSSSIPGLQTASGWRDRPGTTSAAAKQRANVLCSATGEGEEADAAGAAGVVPAEDGYIMCVSQDSEQAPLDPPNDRQTLQEVHQNLSAPTSPANTGPDKVGSAEEGMLADRPLACSEGVLGGRSDRVHAPLTGDDRLAKPLHQALDCKEASSLHFALKGHAALLLRSDRHSLVTETPRGIVAKSVVEQIIAEL